MGSNIRRAYANAASFEETFVGPGGHGVFPGGYGRTTFALGPRIPMAVRGEGCHLWDEAGRKLVDLHNNSTSLIHGNADPRIAKAVTAVLNSGTAFGLPTMLEFEHAEMMIDRLRGVDQIRYANSGTEAIMLAVRLARASTGRSKIAFLRNAYHGLSEPALAASGPQMRRGIPRGVADDIVEVNINDVAELISLFDREGNDIAAVFVDPLPNRVGLVAMTPEFLSKVRALCTTSGALLIADEVIALRLAYGGYVSSMGVTPDLVVTGKIIGGGTPVGAVAGQAQFMSTLNPLDGGIEHGGTFSGNALTMAAGIAAMESFTRSEVDRVNGLGCRLRQRLAAEVDGLGWEARGSGSLVRLFPVCGNPGQVREAQLALWWEAYERGVLLAQNCLGSMSTPMGNSVIDDVADKLADAVAAVASADPPH